MSLIQTVIDEIYDGIPANLHCPNCDTEIKDIDSILDPNAKGDRLGWERMAERVISVVLASVGDAVQDIEVNSLN